MSGRLVETTISPIGWPVAGEVVKDGFRARIQIALGQTRALWSDDPAWLRALSTAALAGANALEAEQPADAGLREGREPQAEETQTFSAVEALKPSLEPLPEMAEVPVWPLPGQEPTEAEVQHTVWGAEPGERAQCPRCDQPMEASPNGWQHRVPGGWVLAGEACRRDPARGDQGEEPAQTRVLPTLQDSDSQETSW